MSVISPIQISLDGRYFVDQAGRPAFWLGDTQWELFRCFTPETAQPILKDRQRKGFNVILVMMTGVDHRHFNKDEPYTNLMDEVPWLDDNPLQPNLRYFQHVDAMIRLGADFGQTFVVGIYHQWHRNVITAKNARAWARWVAARYRDVPNLIWSMYPRAEPDYIPVCRELAVGLHEGDHGAHLISVHPDPSVASSSFMHQEAWLDFNMIQTCITYEKIYEAVLSDYGMQPVKPVVMAEGGYEGIEFGRTQAAYEIRKQAYWTQLAGGYHVYGHNDAWLSPHHWQKWLDSPGSRDLKHFRDIFTSLESWWTLKPEPSIIVDGAGEGDSLNAAARSADNRCIVCYASTPSKITLRLTDEIASHPYSVQTIKPSTGEWSARQDLPASRTHSFVTPDGWEDALVVISSHIKTS